MGRREQHRADTRAAMLAAAVQLFGERGYRATNVEDIAARVGVSTRTFYRYFVSKDGVLAEYGHAVTSAVADRATVDARVPDLVRLYAEVMDEAIARDDFTAIVRLLHENPELRELAHVWRQGWADQLATALAHCRNTSEVPAAWRVRTTVVVQLVSIALDEWLRGGLVASVGEHADRVLEAMEQELR